MCVVLETDEPVSVRNISGSNLRFLDLNERAAQSSLNLFLFAYIYIYTHTCNIYIYIYIITRSMLVSILNTHEDTLMI